jgi:hypothetical protein
MQPQQPVSSSYMQVGVIVLLVPCWLGLLIAQPCRWAVQCVRSFVGAAAVRQK